MSAEIIWLHREDENSVDQIDLATAIDVAIRDLRDIEGHWGTAAGLRRLQECRELLIRAFTSPASGDRDADTLPQVITAGGDVDTITDFVVGVDYLQLDRLSMLEHAETDLDGDALLDTTLTLDDGVVVQVLGVSNVNQWELLAQPADIVQEPSGACASYVHDIRSGRLRECNCKPKEGLGVQSTPGFSECVAEGNMGRCAPIVLIVALSWSSAPAPAQKIEPNAPPASQTTIGDTGNRVLRGDDAPSVDIRVYEARTDADDPPAGPFAKDVDVTVGLGGSVDRAPRDIREPFDE